MKKFLPPFLVFAWLLFALACQFQAEALCAREDWVGLRYGQDGLTFSALAEAQVRRDAPLVYTAWAQENGVRAKTAAQSVELVHIALAGELQSLLDIEWLAGNSPYEASECALSAAAAEALFGGTAVVGLPCTVGGKEMRVSGVFELEGILLAATAAAPTDEIQGIELQLPHTPAGRKEAAIAATGFNVQPSYMRDGSIEALLIRQLGLLPFWLLAFTYSLRLLLHLKRAWKENGVSGRAASAICTGAVVLACFFLAQLRPAWPSGWLPTQWSDFSYWGGLLKSIASNLGTARLHTGLADLLFQRGVQRIMLPLLLSLALLGPLLRFALTRPPAWAAIAAAGIAPFLCVLLLRTRGMDADFSLPALLPIFCMGIEWVSCLISGTILSANEGG